MFLLKSCFSSSSKVDPTLDDYRLEERAEKLFAATEKKIQCTRDKFFYARATVVDLGDDDGSYLGYQEVRRRVVARLEKKYRGNIMAENITNIQGDITREWVLVAEGDMCYSKIILVIF